LIFSERIFASVTNSLSLGQYKSPTQTRLDWKWVAFSTQTPR